MPTFFFLFRRAAFLALARALQYALRVPRSGKVFGCVQRGVVRGVQYAPAVPHMGEEEREESQLLSPPSSFRVVD
jgi:hypothetical protein